MTAPLTPPTGTTPDLLLSAHPTVAAAGLSKEPKSATNTTRTRAYLCCSVWLLSPLTLASVVIIADSVCVCRAVAFSGVFSDIVPALNVLSSKFDHRFGHYHPLAQKSDLEVIY